MTQPTLRSRRTRTMRAASGTVSIITLALVMGACSAPTNQSTDGGAGASAEPVYLQVSDKAYYATTDDMAAAAEIVVLGEVVRVEPGETDAPGAPAGEDSFTQMALYTVKVIEALKGDPGNSIVVWREGFEVSGKEVRPIAFQGILPNEVGDQVLWFLEPAVGNPGVWEQVSLDGVLEVKDGLIFSELDRDGGLADQLRGKPVDEVLGTLRTLTLEP